MAAHVRASFTDDDSLSDHLTLEMVRISAPQTATLATHNDPDERVASDDAAATTGGNPTPANDLLSSVNPGFMEGINREYEIPNLSTYKKVSARNEQKLPTGSTV